MQVKVNQTEEQDGRGPGEEVCSRRAATVFRSNGSRIGGASGGNTKLKFDCMVAGGQSNARFTSKECLSSLGILWLSSGAERTHCTM